MAGLFDFTAWFDGQLKKVTLIQERGERGRFVTNRSGDYIGVIDGVKGVVRQDNDARIYFIPQVEQLESRW